MYTVQHTLHHFHHEQNHQILPSISEGKQISDTARADLQSLHESFALSAIHTMTSNHNLKQQLNLTTRQSLFVWQPNKQQNAFQKF